MTHRCELTLGAIMASRRGRATALALAFVAGWPGSARAADPPERSFAGLAQSLLPTVVNISTRQKSEPGERGEGFEKFFRDFFERRQGKSRRPRRGPSSLGSGFVIDPDGYIVTNNHVIAEAETISVHFQDDTSRQAKVLGRDEKTDLAR